MPSPSPERRQAKEEEARRVFAQAPITTPPAHLSHHEKIVWCAAFFDGEGFIGVGFTTHVYLRLGAAQIVREPLDRLVELFGGTISLDRSRPEGLRPIHRWSCAPVPALRALELMLPYLIVKREQAAVAIRYLQRRKVHAAYRPPDWYERDVADLEQIRELKHRAEPRGDEPISGIL